MSGGASLPAGGVDDALERAFSASRAEATKERADEYVRRRTESGTTPGSKGRGRGRGRAHGRSSRIPSGADASNSAKVGSGQRLVKHRLTDRDVRVMYKLNKELQAARDADDPARAAATAKRLGILLVSRGLYEKAVPCLRSALEYYAEIGDSETEAAIFDGVAQAYYLLSNHAADDAALQRTLDFYQRIGGRPLDDVARMVAAANQSLPGSTEAAARSPILTFNFIREHAKSTGQPIKECEALLCFAGALRRAGSEPEALAAYLEAYSAATDRGLDDLAGSASLALGNMHLTAGNENDSVEWYTKHLEAASRADPGGYLEMQAQSNLCVLYIHISRWRSALESAQLYEKLARATGDRVQIAKATAAIRHAERQLKKEKISASPVGGKLANRLSRILGRVESPEPGADANAAVPGNGIVRQRMRKSIGASLKRISRIGRRARSQSPEVESQKANVVLTSSSISTLDRLTGKQSAVNGASVENVPAEESHSTELAPDYRNPPPPMSPLLDDFAPFSDDAFDAAVAAVGDVDNGDDDSVKECARASAIPSTPAESALAQRRGSTAPTALHLHDCGSNISEGPSIKLASPTVLLPPPPSPFVAPLSPKPEEVYVALYDFEPSGEGELPLHVGEKLTDLTALTDGWVFGTSASTGRSGMFPLSYVSVAKLILPDAVAV